MSSQPSPKKRARIEKVIFCDHCHNMVHLSLKSPGDKEPMKNHLDTANCKKLSEYWAHNANPNEDYERIRQQMLIARFSFEAAIAFVLSIFSKTKLDLLFYLLVPIKESHNSYSPQLGLRLMNFMKKCKLSIQKMHLVLPKISERCDWRRKYEWAEKRKLSWWQKSKC